MSREYSHDEHIYSCDGEGHKHHHHADGACCCHHHELEFHGLNKILLTRIILAAFCFVLHHFLHEREVLGTWLLIASALLAGYDIIFEALRNLVRLRVFDEYFLMTFAAATACIVGEFHEGAAVMLLFRIGDFCQDYAIRRSRKTIFSLTGEYGTSEGRENKTVTLITRFAEIYTPSVLVLAVLIAVCLWIFAANPLSDSVYRALTFLVLACPCAIVISVPLCYSAGIGAAAQKGIYFHDSAALDALASAKAVDSISLYEADGGYSVLTAAKVILKEEASATQAIRIAIKTKRIARENIWFAILAKLSVLVLGAFGISELWFAVFADSGVTMLLILNSLRAFWLPKS